MTCKFCEQRADETGICVSCQERLGLTPGSGVRRSAPCAKCNHGELVRALVRELTTTPGEYGQRETVPMAVTYAPLLKESFWSGAPKGAHGVIPGQPAGTLEMYVCRKCGFTEWYCRDPSAIPIGPEHGTELVGVAGEGPYR
jgi:hypothetical protein